MILHPNGLPYGTVRRAPSENGFAHAVLLDQGGHYKCWSVVDLYGPMDLLTDVEVANWPVVYEPMDDDEWEQTA